jgi:hypothetical protein
VVAGFRQAMDEMSTIAVIAYDNAAREYWDEFACFNFPKEGEQSALREK